MEQSPRQAGLITPNYFQLNKMPAVWSFPAAVAAGPNL